MSKKQQNPKTDERKKTVSEQNTPSEKPIDSGELQFRKVLYGFDPDEVAAYILELHSTYAAAAKIHESKLSSIKEELVLSNRERTSYAQKAKEIQTRESRIAEYEALAAQSAETIEALKAEIERLNSQPAPVPAPAPVVADNSYIQRISELEDALEQLRNKNVILARQAAANTALEDEYKSVLAQLESAKSRLEVREKELKSKADEISEKTARIAELAAEINRSKKAVNELEIKVGILTRSDSEKAEEIAALKEAGSNAAIRNAERINELENEHAKKVLAMQKDMKLYSYYAERAELSVAELSKQIEMIKQSLANSF